MKTAGGSHKVPSQIRGLAVPRSADGCRRLPTCAKTAAILCQRKAAEKLEFLARSTRAYGALHLRPRPCVPPCAAACRCGRKHALRGTPGRGHFVLPAASRLHTVGDGKDLRVSSRPTSRPVANAAVHKLHPAGMTQRRAWRSHAQEAASPLGLRIARRRMRQASSLAHP